MQTPEHTQPNGVEEQQIFGPFFFLHRPRPGAGFCSMKQGLLRWPLGAQWPSFDQCFKSGLLVEETGSGGDAGAETFSNLPSLKIEDEEGGGVGEGGGGRPPQQTDVNERIHYKKDGSERWTMILPLYLIQGRERRNSARGKSR